MKPQWENLYSQMLVDINRCKTLDLPETERAESCYGIAINYWHRVKTFFMVKLNYSDAEEIEFFKIVKPQFTSHIEYYLIMNQGLLFIPENLNEKFEYWQVGVERYQRFCDRNLDFIRYYESTSKVYDADYFLQRNNRLVVLPQERIFEDNDCRTSHDHIVRGLLANRMYHEYAGKRLNELKPPDPNSYSGHVPPLNGGGTAQPRSSNS